MACKGGSDKTPPPGYTVHPSDHRIQNVSVDLAILPQDTQSPAIPVVADHPTPSIADGEPILQSGDPDFASQAAVTITPTVSFINGRHEITLEPHSQIEEEAKGTQIMTNVTTLGASDEITTVFDYTDLPVDSSNESIELQTTMLTSTEIQNEYETDIIPIVESTPPQILPGVDELTTKGPTQNHTTSVPASTMENTESKSALKVEAGPAVTYDTERMYNVTATSADFVPTVTPAAPHITTVTKETQTTKADVRTTSVVTTSAQEEVGESGRTPLYVKSDSYVTQTEKPKDESPVTSPTELYRVRDKAETTEETKSTSAPPAAEDSPRSTLQTVYTPFSDDADETTLTSTTSDSQSSTQDVEGEKETQAPKEFAFSTTAPLVSSSLTTHKQTAKTEIAPAIDVRSTESSASVPSTLAENVERTVTSQGGSTASQMSSVSSAEKATTDAMSTPEEEGSGVQTVQLTTGSPSETSAGTAISGITHRDQATGESEMR
nr:PREDICTED: probable GPI-anchored adhesin-like protein PGA18 [Notothenia coriiceps]